MAQTHGSYDPKFQGVRDKFRDLLESGVELGASLTVTLDGEDVVNLWGGYADPARSRPWNEDTIVNVFSTTKTICALAVLLLINEGELSPYDKVSKYWPEFAANGKENVEVRHLLSHSSGVAAFEDPITLQEMCDSYELVIARLEKQPARWEPGTASGYHAWTYGYLLGELVRRKTGLSLTDFVAQRIAGPLGADLQIGAKEQDWPRVAELVPPPAPPAHIMPEPETSPDSLKHKMLYPFPDPSFANTVPWKKAEIAAANGHSNSKALATIWSRALTTSDESKRLLSQETIDLIYKEQTYGPDLCMGFPIRYGIGMGLRGNGDTPVDSWLPEGRICFWGGWGGSMLLNDLDRRVTIAYAMNKMSPGAAGNEAIYAYVAEIYKALEVPIPTANGNI
ncbi:beta-lactamase [Colletotrichum orchidophilum]|uniref:Beta-lactamase n=1 Tax=Colletotrichum orchidophilum TaxID=1209926 RepID=A0A1G4B6I9_9PEZI|nr:beta-lactamase [Colletotrichum orchidophilum]OHE96946.1 beta-lactamase [Colletotrichum orchidophilum]